MDFKLEMKNAAKKSTPATATKVRAAKRRVLADGAIMILGASCEHHLTTAKAKV